jgi:hypothetical protein
VLYLYERSRDYNPPPKLETIKARLLAINAADDERNSVELGIMEREIKRVKHGQYVLIRQVTKHAATKQPRTQIVEALCVGPVASDRPSPLVLAKAACAIAAGREPPPE